MLDTKLEKGRSNNGVFALFVLGCMVTLYQIWSPLYFLTTDGPCHLYNAEVLRGLFTHKEAGFYSIFYTINTQISANWFSHLLLAILLCFFKASIAEKILITMYMLLLLSGIAKLVQLLQKGQYVLLLGAFIFVFNVPLLRGFYNFSFSVALFPWFVYIFLRVFHKPIATNVLLAFLISFSTFLAHPLGYIISFVVGGFLLLTTHSYAEKTAYSLYKKLGVFGCIQLPLLISAIYFNQQNNTTHFKLFFNRNFITTYFLQFTSFQCFNEKEEITCILAVFLLLTTMVVLLLNRLKTKKCIQPYDGILYGIGFIFCIYIFFPDGYSMQLLELRLQLFVYMAMYIWMVCTMKNQLHSTILSLGLFGIFLLLSFLRIPTIHHTDKALQEMLIVEKNMQPNSTVLALHFAHQGKDKNGHTINTKIGVFSHAHQYLGVEKPMLFLDNYEANTGYFPLSFKDSMNPYIYACKHDALESEEAEVEIEQYELISKHHIDYVLYYFFDSTLLNNTKIAETNRQIQNLYTNVYRSPSGRTLLFKRK